MAYASAAAIDWWPMPGIRTGGTLVSQATPPRSTGNSSGANVGRPRQPVQGLKGTGSVTRAVPEVEDRTVRTISDDESTSIGDWRSAAFDAADGRAALIEKTNQDRTALLNRAFDAEHSFTTPESERLRILNRRIAMLVPGITDEETSELEAITGYLEQVQSSRLCRLEKFGLK